jgi:hypothetical protein
MSSVPALVEFDYGSLSSEARIVVQQKTSEIRSLVKRSAQDAIEIGQKLLEVKNCLGHGGFLKWVYAEFGWSDRTAERYMLVAREFDNLANLDGQIAPSALYLLAAPSTPEEAKTEALQMAESGETVTHAKAKELIAAKKSGEIAPGQTVTVVANRSPIQGEEVTVKSVDGDIITVQASDGATLPFLPKELATTDASLPETRAASPAKNPTPKPAEKLEGLQTMLEVERDRIQKLEDWINRAIATCLLPEALVLEAQVLLGLI